VRSGFAGVSATPPLSPWPDALGAAVVVAPTGVDEVRFEVAEELVVAVIDDFEELPHAAAIVTAQMTRPHQSVSCRRRTDIPTFGKRMPGAAPPPQLRFR